MTRTIVLDSGPLSLLCAHRNKASTIACINWLEGHIAGGIRCILPEIADYEVRRELLRARQVGSVRRLDALAGRIEYLPITTTAMRMAADFWSAMRQAGLPTAGERAIDADCILAGHAASLGLSDIIVATTNVRHIARFVPAATWESIT